MEKGDCSRAAQLEFCFLTKGRKLISPVFKAGQISKETSASVDVADQDIGGAFLDLVFGGEGFKENASGLVETLVSGPLVMACNWFLAEET